METDEFRSLYRQTFKTLGVLLTAKDGLSDKMIATAEKRLGFRLPTALREYYLVAGRERPLNHAHNRLLAIEDVDVHRGKLVFMEENQWAVVWGVTANRKKAGDPAVYQGPIVNDEPSGWFIESKSVSSFLVFMLHMQAAFGGGMPFTASGPAEQSLVATLDKGWRFGGEINGMRAYSRSNQAICFAKWQDFFAKEETWRVFAGACDKDSLLALASELKLRWD